MHPLPTPIGWEGAGGSADYLIQIILAQPDTVLAMEASELDEIGQTLIHNCEAWLS
jgi:hypothetical protein